MTIKRAFPKDQLLAWGLPFGDDWEDEQAQILDNVECGSGRWESYHRVIFVAPDDHLTYAANYSQGLTENQDERPWEYGRDVVCEQVEKIQRVITVTDWLPVKHAEPVEVSVPTIAQLKSSWAQNKEDDAAAAEDGTWD